MIKKNKRFYFKANTEDNEAVEVYVGQNAGSQLEKELNSANEEILIISPYIDEKKLDDLIALKNRNINVKLAFSDLKDRQRNRILRKLIHQHKEVDIEEKNKMTDRAQQLFIYSLIILIFSAFLLVGLFYIQSLLIRIVILFLLGGSIFWCYKLWNKSIDLKNTEVFRYSYSKKINFYYFWNPRNEYKFIHSKIYIIDKKVAYLGSLNFTKNGFTTNFETRVRITQKEKISELVDFVNEIFEDNYNFNKHTINYLGKSVYTEERFGTSTLSDKQ